MFKKLVGLLTVAVAGLLLSGVASAQITGSVHDFTGELTPNTDLCAFCHTPHDSDTSVSDAPLWDHALTVAAYTPYGVGSTTMDATMSGDATTFGISRLCLSCHDGTVAVDSYGGTTGTNTMLSIPAWTGVGANYKTLDLSAEHPVSVTTTADADVRDTPTAAETRVFGGMVECASCHDVHDQSGQPSLLVMDNAGSAMCLSCHIK